MHKLANTYMTAGLDLRMSGVSLLTAFLVPSVYIGVPGSVCRMHEYPCTD